MNKRLQRSILLVFSVGLLFIVVTGLSLWKAKQQYALNRQLITALVHNDTKQALVLVNEGADPNTRYTPLPGPTLQFLWHQWLHHQPVPANASPTALMFACGARYCLTYEGGVPLVGVAENLPLLKAMLLHKADVHLHTIDNDTSFHGENSTALHIAADLGRLHTVELLVDYGADINAQDQTGSTPLKMAIEGGHIDISRLLLSHGAHVNAEDAEGYTPLMWAVLYDNRAMVRLLLEKGANVNSQNEEGRTPLHFAARYGKDLDIVRQLLAHGADPSLPSKAGMTPLEIATKDERIHLLPLLLRARRPIKSHRKK